jgi:hypothetical protein
MLSGLDIALTIDSEQYNPFTVMNPPGPQMLILLERFFRWNQRCSRQCISDPM